MGLNTAFKELIFTRNTPQINAFLPQYVGEKYRYVMRQIHINLYKSVIGWNLMHERLNALVPSVVKNSKSQLTRVKRCR